MMDVNERMQSYREYIRRKSEKQRLKRAQLKEKAVLLNPHKTRKYNKRNTPSTKISPDRPLKESRLELLVTTTELPLKYDLSPAGLANLEEYLVPRKNQDLPPSIVINPHFSEDDFLAIPEKGKRHRHPQEEAVIVESKEAPIDTSSGNYAGHELGLFESEEDISQANDALQPEHEPAEHIYSRVVEEVEEEEEDYLEWPIDEEQEAFYCKRDQILRLMDQLDKDDRLEYLSKVERLLRDGVRKRIRKEQPIVEQ